MLHTLHITLGSINLSVCVRVCVFVRVCLCIQTTRQGCPTVVWQKATTGTAGCFAGRHIKFAIIDIQAPKLLCNI